VTLVLDHVAKSYRTRGVWTDVLRDVNATFEPGQSVGILGAPKSGKSTLKQRRVQGAFVEVRASPSWSDPAVARIACWRPAT
jgi:ABC-type glutathione transport system ATPase component